MTTVELIDLTKESLEDYQKLISADGIELIGEGPCVAFGIAEDDFPVGAIVAGIDDGEGEIVSLFVLPKKRRRGYGTELVYEAINKLYDFDNLYSIKATFAENTEPNGLKEFFEFLEFEFEQDEILGSFSFSLADLAASKKVKGKIDERVISLRDTLTTTKNAIKAKYGHIGDFSRYGRIDTELSCIVNDPDKEPGDVSCLFVGKVRKKKELVIVWAYAAENTLDFIHMLRFAIVRALKKYGKDMLVRAPYINERSRTVIHKLLEGKETPANRVWNVSLSLDWELTDKISDSE